MNIRHCYFFQLSDDASLQRTSQDRVPVSANAWMVEAMAAADVDESHSNVNEDTPVAEVSKTACVEAVTLTLAPQANEGDNDLWLHFGIIELLSIQVTRSVRFDSLC